MNGALDSKEGCATISDSIGQILFYTDGVKVYNKLHQVMFNGTGLMGHSSSSQSAIIVPKPGSNTIYYIFTADAVENNLANGYRYSIVDMQLAGGLGAVTTKNVLLAPRCTEKLTATTHANGIDAWILTATYGDSSFRAFKLTCSGLDTIPIISKVGTPHLGPPFSFGDPVGCMKVSPDGKKLATTRPLRYGWEILDFNNATGVLSNPIFIPQREDRIFGVEFSPSSKLLYIATECCSSDGSIHQFKIDIHDSITIKNSHYRVDSSFHYKNGIQLGPDNKIYTTNSEDSSLNVIHYPDIYGPGCNYVYKAINLNGRYAQRCLPTFYSKVINNSAVDFTYTVSPDCQTINFSGLSALPPPLTCQWNFGDGTFATGQNVTHVFPTTSNSYNVILTVINPDSCGATGTKMKTVAFNRVYPDAKFGFTTSCGNLTVNFRDSSTIASGAIITAWQWDFGDNQTSTSQHPIHTYSAFGQYTVKLIVTSSDGCQTKDTITRVVTVTPAPNAVFSFNAGCLNTNIQFRDSSTVLAGNIVSWQWDFGDGGVSTLQHPAHSYSTPGAYPISLIVKAANGCADTLNQNIQITPKPVANFSFTLGCINSPVLFSDSSTIGSGNITKWFWDFGNGDTSSRRNPSVVYNTAGTYIVKLIVFSQSNCASDTVIKTIAIESKPVADFLNINTCGSRTVQFQDNSTITSGKANSWFWQFGDGSTSVLQNPDYTYSDFGVYTVKFISRTQNGCTADTISKQVIVRAKPVVNFNLPAVCLLDAMAQFSNLTSIADNSSLSYFWSFGDYNAVPGTDTSTQVNAQHTYSAAAQYEVKLVATSAYGCRDSITRSFTVNGAVPKADFRVINSNSLCSNVPVSIKDSSTVDFGNITRIKIYWGDGDSTVDLSPLQAPNSRTYTHQYALFGSPQTRSFIITMYSYSGTLCVHSTSRTITINAAPQIQFTALPEVCHEAPPLNITQAAEIWGLSGTGYYSGNGITNAGSGTFSPAIAGVGTHSVTYSFITNAGCRADSTQTLRINPTPVALFSFNSACLPNATIQFTNRSSANDFSLGQMQYQWNFDDLNGTAGNPNTSTATHPAHTYTSLGTHNVNLSVTTPKGCRKDTTIAVLPDINIYRQPVADFAIDSSKLLCEGTQTIFINTSDSAGSNLTKWIWNFGDGTIDSSRRKPSHLYATANTYTPNLQVENSKGCKSSITTRSIVIESLPNTNFDFDTTCLGRPIQFTDRSTNRYGNITTWQWNFDDGNSIGVQHPVHTYTTYRAYNVRLTASTLNGCSSSLNKTISINRVTIYAGRDTMAAINQPIQLQAIGAANYLWSPSTGLNNSAIANPVARLLHDQQYVVKGTTASGCIGYDTINVKVFKGADIYVPTAFTPNGDSKNDYFGPVCVGVKSLDYFTVYNRWGQVVFTTKDLNGKWNGAVNGQLQTGAFVWVAKGISYDGRVIEKKGTVVLIK